MHRSGHTEELILKSVKCQEQRGMQRTGHKKSIAIRNSKCEKHLRTQSGIRHLYG